MNDISTFFFYFFFYGEFFIIDNEILKAHTVARSKSGTPDFFCKGGEGVSPHPRPPVAYNCYVSVLSKHMQQDRSNNSVTDWWDLHMQIR